MKFHGIVRNVARVLSLPPLQAIFEPSKVCDLHCDYCRRNEEASIRQIEGVGNHFTPQEFKEVLDKLKHIRVANWIGDGEPLMNPEFNKLIEMAAERGIKTTFGTNGMLVTKADVNFWKTHKVIEVSISIDSPIPEKYEMMRRGATFEKVIRACKLVSDAGLKLQMQIIAFAETIPDMPRFVDLAIEMGAQRIAFPRPHLYGTLHEKYSSSYPDSAVANPILEICRDKMKRVGIKWYEPWLITPYFRRCMWPYLSPYIQIGGTIQSCCFMQGKDRVEYYEGAVYKVPATSYEMGNILTDDFDNIWRGKAYKELRGLLIKSEKPIGTSIEVEQLHALNRNTSGRFSHCLGCAWRWSTEC